WCSPARAPVPCRRATCRKARRSASTSARSPPNSPDARVALGTSVALPVDHRGADGLAVRAREEALFCPSWMPRELCYVFKRELLYIPFFGWDIALLDMIHIDRRKGVDAFEQVVRQGARKLAEGRWIIMFPEGTRTRVGAPARSKSGGPRLAPIPPGTLAPEELGDRVETWI